MLGWRSLIFLFFCTVSVFYVLEREDKSHLNQATNHKKSAQLDATTQQKSVKVLKSPQVSKSPTFTPNTAPEAVLDEAKTSKNAKTVPFIIDGDGLAVAFGDIVLGVPAAEVSTVVGIAEAPKIKLWPQREIPFHIQADFPHPDRVLEAISHFRDTPITFVPYTNQKDALIFEPKTEHCKSYLGNVGGLQPIWLSENCQPTQIIHEIMHALGFIHEHSRTDRDQYLEIVWDNIEDDFKTQFVIAPESLMLGIKGRPFDFESVMIYSAEAFSRRPGDITIKSKAGKPIRPTPGLSLEDLSRLIAVYGNR